MRNKKIFYLSILLVGLVWIVAGMGLLYIDNGKSFVVDNIYGQEIKLFGNGIYAYNSMLKATTSKGTDIIMFLVSIGFLITTIFRERSDKIKIVHAGFLVSLLYYATNIAFGITYNMLFIIYLITFSVALFTIIFTIIDIY
ncbi:MAG: hypothetical protein ACK5LC_17005 [Coprobacillaceae bacterium]